MSNITYTATDTPVTIATMNNSQSAIVVTDDLSISDLTVDIQITAPNEGFGVDPTLLIVWLRVDYADGSYVQAKLQDGTPDSLAFVEFDTTRIPVQTINAFNGFNTKGTWKLIVFNFSSTATGTINGFGINVTYPTPNSGVPHLPSAPTARTLSPRHYGEGINLRKNVPIDFVFGNCSGTPIYKSSYPTQFAGSIEDFRLSQLNTDVAFSLHRITSGSYIDKVILSKSYSGVPSSTYLVSNYNISSGNKVFIKGDHIYLSIDSPMYDSSLVCGQCILRKN